MPAWTLLAAPRRDVPGAIIVTVTGPPDTVSALWRQDGAEPRAPVRNYDSTGPTGLESVTDHEAPLGRPVKYTLTDGAGRVVAATGMVTAPPMPDGRALLRSELRPQVGWMACEPQDETGVAWRTSTTVHDVVGSSTPIVVGETRQRRNGLITFLAKSITEADTMLALMRDGVPLLLRNDPCAARQVRDLLFYALEVREARWGRSGWRLIACQYQETEFVAGPTDEAPLDWDFEALAASAPTFGALAGLWPNFAAMATQPRDPWEPPL